MSLRQHLDPGSTIFERYGRQEGSLKGHNPRQFGRPSHHREIWRGENRRTDMENRIAERKHDFDAVHFCLKHFHAAEPAFRSVLLLLKWCYIGAKAGQLRNSG